MIGENSLIQLQMNQDPNNYTPSNQIIIQVGRSNTIQYFSDKQKVIHFIDTESVLQVFMNIGGKERAQQYDSNNIKIHTIIITHKFIFIILLNVNDLHSPIKRHRVDKCIRKAYPILCCLQVTYLNHHNKHILILEGQKIIVQENGHDKIVRTIIL